MMRLVADRLDSKMIQKVIAPPKGERWGSLKSLEKFIATSTSPDVAHSLMAPLFGAYELRLHDAHIGSTEIEETLSLVQVERKSPSVIQGFQLIAAVTGALIAVERSIRATTKVGRDSSSNQSDSSSTP
jgi:hypothetical protein